MVGTKYLADDDLKESLLKLDQKQGSSDRVDTSSGGTHEVHLCHLMTSRAPRFGPSKMVKLGTMIEGYKHFGRQGDSTLVHQ